MNKAAGDTRRVGDLYDWLSRFMRFRYAIASVDRDNALSMHKTLRIPSTEAPRYRDEQIFYIDDRALEAAMLAPGSRVLDAGCGFGGTIFRWHSRIGGQYDGLTLSRVQQRIAQREASRRGIGAECQFHLRSFDEPISATYDAVVAIEALIYSPDIGHTLGNLSAGISPGGQLVIVDDIPADDLGDDPDALQLKAFWSTVAIPSTRMYRAAAERNGMRIIHDADYTSCVVTRSPAGLRRLETMYRMIDAALPLAGPRSITAAFLGGLALERLYSRGLMEYRLLVIRRDR